MSEYEIEFTKGVCLVSQCIHFGVIIDLPFKVPLPLYMSVFDLTCAEEIEFTSVTPQIQCDCGAELYRATDDSQESMDSMNDLIERYS